MSDDYVTMDVPDNMTYEQIDALTQDLAVFQGDLKLLWRQDELEGVGL